MSPQNSDLSSSDSNQKTSGIFGSLLNGRFWPMGAVGAAAVAAALWLSAAGLSGPAGELLPAAEAEEEEGVAIENAEVHETLAQVLEQEEANVVALVEDWERKHPTPEVEHVEVDQASEEGVATYINRSYRIPMAEARQLTAWALEIGQGFDVDPLLILSVAATESSFNPKAKNGSGAEGLMQVMTRVHAEKFKAFGGPAAALEPYPNMVVGASILSRLIARTGSVSKGLKFYYGAGNKKSDNGYSAKVFKERSRMLVAASGDSDRAVQLSRTKKAGPDYNAKHRPTNLGYGEWTQIIEARAQEHGSVKQLAADGDAPEEKSAPAEKPQEAAAS